jgi:hypothetical protein
MTFLPFHRQLFFLSFIFITVTFLFESQTFTFSAGSLKISSETHPLFIISAGLAFLQGIFIWILRVKKNLSFPESIGYFHFFASFISLFGLDFFVKRMPTSLFLTSEEARWLPFLIGAIWFVCILYISSFILFLSTSFILLTKREEQLY